MRRPVLVLTLTLISLAISALIVAGLLMTQVEQSPYTVERNDGAIELRAYPSLTVATTIVEGSRGAAIQKGFRVLAGYIFGANDGAKKIEMTAPVMQGGGATAASSGVGSQAWTVRFVMPRSWTMASLPRPKDSGVELEQTPPTTFAVIRFSGFARDALLEQKTKDLKAYIAREHLTPHGDPIYAFYNPPWTLPFFRRNEVMIPVAPLP